MTARARRHSRQVKGSCGGRGLDGLSRGQEAAMTRPTVPSDNDPPDEEPSPEDPSRFPSRPQLSALDEAPDGQTPSDTTDSSESSLPPGA